MNVRHLIDIGNISPASSLQPHSAENEDNEASSRTDASASHKVTQKLITEYYQHYVHCQIFISIFDILGHVGNTRKKNKNLKINF